jgi:hypothetical protein
MLSSRFTNDLGHCGIEAGRGSNPSATIKTTTSIMATKQTTADPRRH